jgi:hypothetical protein
VCVSVQRRKILAAFEASLENICMCARWWWRNCRQVVHSPVSVHVVDEKGFLQILDPSLVSSSTKEFWVASKLSTLCLSDDQDHFLHGEWECDHA